MKLAIGSMLLFIKLQFFPNTNLLFWMALAIAADFATGVAKAYSRGEARTSSGYRKTIVKAFQYLGALVCGIILANASQDSNNPQLVKMLTYVNDGLVIFITYIEITSIFENLVALDTTSMMSKYFFKPALSILTFQLKNNPVIKQAEAMTKKTDQV